MVATPKDDALLRRILEACYAAEDEGREPDLEALCAPAPRLRHRIERMLQRERDAFGAAPRRAVHTPTPLAMPARVGEFVPIEPVGVGGMSHVYRARQEALGRDVALKVLRSELVASGTGRLRFTREASITAALEHPHIVPVYAAGEADGHVFLAMKLLRGPSLDRLAVRPSAREVAAIGVAIASALQAAHDIGVVHRDVKPANVLIENGHAYIVDFGLAAFAHQAGVLTRPDSTPGTLVYLAPELARRSGTGLDARVDVYGLGVTLYELLAGRPPFPSNNPVRTLHEILYVEPPPLGLRGADRDLETIVLKAIEKLPQNRFQTAALLAEDLQAWLDGRPIRARRPGLVGRARRFVRRNPLASALTTVTLVAVVALATTLWRQHAEHRQRAQLAESQVQTALERGDLLAGAAALRRFVDERGDAGRAGELTAELACERQLQTLVAAMHLTATQQDTVRLRQLVDAIAGSTTAVAKTARADAALAVATRLLDADPVGHRGLSAATRAAMPRTVAALGAWSAHSSPSAALRALGERGGGACDHLLAALVARIASDRTVEFEQELRRVAADAPIQFALCACLEAQGRPREAADAIGPLVDHPVLGPVALAAAARLEALLGDAPRALDHLARARAQPTDELLALQVRVSALQVLCCLESTERFEDEWSAAQPELGHLPEYWRLGGYARDQAGDPGGARERFEAALARQPRLPVRLGLESTLLQLAWQEADVRSFEPLPEEQAEERAVLTRLVAAAQAFVDRNHAEHAASTYVADAMVVGALARRTLGDLAGGWELLERACRDSATPEVLVTHSSMVADRVARVLQGGRDLDELVAAPLPVAAARGLAHAQRVIAAAATGAPVRAEDLQTARRSAFYCAVLLGEAAVALPAAIELRTALGPVGTTAIDWGGVWLDVVQGPEDHFASLLLAGVRTLDAELRSKRLDPGRVAAVLARWRDHAKVAGRLASEEAPWPALQAAMTELADRAR